ncbi:hypothetical protein KZ686_03435 [Cupriavidus cauae]|nr:hypothetical protein KZ686_03435 [Cupriavidus cauae]
MLIGAFIALPHFLNLDDPDAAIPVEQHAMVAHAQSVAVGMVVQGFDVLALGHRMQCADRFHNGPLLELVHCAQLFGRLAGPVDRVHPRDCSDPAL